MFPSRLRDAPPWVPLVALGSLALAWRLFLVKVYAGWEEGDFGYLGMTRGLLATRFAVLEMDETPLYFVLSALVLAVVGDARVATLCVSMGGGVLTCLLGFALARRLFGEGPAWAVGLALVFQPELALFSATAMREPVYSALIFGALLLLFNGRVVGAGSLLATTLLVRFDTLVANVPTFLYHAMTGKSRVSNSLKLFWIVFAVAGAWALYCQEYHGTWKFWAGAVGKNVASAEGQELGTAVDQVKLSLGVVGALLTDTLPQMVGWPLLVGAAWHGWKCGRGQLRRPEPTVSFLVGTNLAAWLGLGAISRYEPSHNLYWKWMLLLCALLCVTGVRGLHLLAREVGKRWPRGALAGMVVAALWTAVAMGRETWDQVDRSQRLIRPYVELADWVDAHVPRSRTLLFDYIPLMWMERNPLERPVILWEGVDSPPGDAAAFGEFLKQRKIAYVLWLKEEWTGAPKKAPFLALPGVHPLGPVVLTAERTELEAGFIWYRVDPLSGSPATSP